MDTLPDELLVDVLRDAVDVKAPRRRLLSFMLVCQRWHAVIMACPHFWTDVRAQPHTSSASLRTQIELSGTLPLSLSFKGCRIADWEEVAQVLLSAAPKITELYFSVSNDFTSQIHSHDWGPIGHTDDLLMELFRQGINLSCLSLVDVTLWPDYAEPLYEGTHRSLTKVKLWRCEIWDYSLSELLGSSPHLNELSLRFVDFQEGDNSLTTEAEYAIDLPNLRILDIAQTASGRPFDIFTKFYRRFEPSPDARITVLIYLLPTLVYHPLFDAAPHHHLTNWEIFNEADSLGIYEDRDLSHLVIRAAVDGTDAFFELDATSPAVYSVHHMLATMLPDAARAFSNAPITRLVVDVEDICAHLWVADLVTEERQPVSAEAVAITTEMWHAVLTNLPELEYVEVRRRDIVRPLCQALEPRNDSLSLLCPNLTSLVFSMYQFQDDTVAALLHTCALRAAHGARMKSVLIELHEKRASWELKRSAELLKNWVDKLEIREPEREVHHFPDECVCTRREHIHIFDYGSGSDSASDS